MLPFKFPLIGNHTRMSPGDVRRLLRIECADGTVPPHAPMRWMLYRLWCRWRHSALDWFHWSDRIRLKWRRWGHTDASR